MTREQLRSVENIERILVEKLVRQKNGYVSIDWRELFSWPDYTVRKELERRFKLKGRVLTFHDDDCGHRVVFFK